MAHIPKCFQNSSDYDPHYCAECAQERDCYKRWVKKLEKESEIIPRKVMNKYEEALARARKGLPLNEIFPELKPKPGDKWIDLGLPSGRLWAAENELDFYNFDKAVKTFGKELPSKEAWQELFDKCTRKWDDEKKGFLLTGPNGNTIFLSAAGECYDMTLYSAGLGGYYWSSSPYSTATHAYYVGFGAGGVSPQNYDGRFLGFSVRLAREPQTECEPKRYD